MDVDQRIVEVDAPAPTYATIPVEVYHSTIWVNERCGETCGDNHLAHKGQFLDAQGWDDDLDGIGDPDAGDE